MSTFQTAAGSVVPEVDPGPNSSVAVTTDSDVMAATYGVAYLTGGETVLVGATDSASDDDSGALADTDLQAAIVTGASVNRVELPLPAGATTSTAYIGGAAVTALTNGNFAVLYWGSNLSDGSGGTGSNAELPDYYIQVYTPGGTTVGALVTLADTGIEGNAVASIFEDTANAGFVVAANDDDNEDVVVQRYNNAGASSGSELSFPGEVAYEDSVDSDGDIIVPCDTEYIFIPDGAASSSDAVQESGPGGQVTANPSGGFVAFWLDGSTDVDAETISTSGALGSTITLGDVGSTIASNDLVWDAVTLSSGGYALVLDPDPSNQFFGYPATNQVIEVGSLAPSSATVEDLTTSGGDTVPVGPWAVADGSAGGIATYTDIPDNSSDYSPASFPLNASLSATTYLDSGPSVTASATKSFREGGSSVALDPTLGITDPSSTTLVSARVAVGSGFTSGDTLSADTGGTSIGAAYDSSTGVLTLNGTDTLANYETVLDSVAYGFTGDPTSGGTDTSRTIDWSVNDGTTTSSTATSTLNVERQQQAALSVTSLSGTAGTALTLTTSGGSGTGGVSFTAVDGTATGCSVSGVSLSTTSSGTCSVTATKAGDGDYEPVSSGATTVTFDQATQAALSLTSTGGTFGTALTLTASGGSGSGAVSYTATDGTATGCLVSGSSLTATSSGTCSVTATKAGDAIYSQISSDPTTVTLAGQAQAALTVTSLSGTYGSALTLTTSGGSGTGAVSFTAVDGTATGCSVSGSALSVTAPGTCTVTATKAADSTYAQVSSDPTTVSFAKAGQAALTVTSLSGTYGSALTLTTSGGSGTGSLSFTAGNGTATDCSVSGSTLTSTSAGSCSVTATKAADGNYLIAVSAATTVTFGKASQAIVFNSTAPSGATVGGSYQPAASASSGLAVSIVLAGSSSGCSLSSGLVRFTGPGVCVLDATQPGDGNWFAAVEMTQSITVAAAPTTTTTTTGTTTTTTTGTTPTSTPKPKPPHKHKPKPKPKPERKQHLIVRISGVKPGATYFGNVPTPRCVAHANFGTVACRIARGVTPTRDGSTVTFTAGARGSSGVKATARVTVHSQRLELGGLRPANGVYIVKVGTTYTLRVASRIKPLYVTAAVAPLPPAGVHDWFHRSGSAHGIPIWTLRVYLETSLSGFPAWNIGIKIGNRVRVLTIHT